MIQRLFLHAGKCWAAKVVIGAIPTVHYKRDFDIRKRVCIFFCEALSLTI